MWNFLGRRASKQHRTPRVLVLVVACASLAFPSIDNAHAQDPVKPKQPDEKGIQVIPFFDTSEGFEVRAAVTLIAEGGPWRALAVRMAISENVPAIPSWQFHFDRMFPLTQRYLDAIEDGRRLPDLRGKEVMKLSPPDRGLYVAYLEAIARSYQGELEQFKRSVEGREKVVYTHLKRNPGEYRGRIVPVHGKLTAIRQNDAPAALRKFQGIQHTYFAWITTETKGAPPYGVIFTHLPKELEVSEKLDAEVTIHGYFLAHVLIPAETEAGREKKAFTTPWVVGKTLIVHPKAAQPKVEESSYSYYIIVTTLGGIVIVAILVAILLIWHRGGDAKTQAKLASVRDKHQPFTLPPADEEPAPPPFDGQAGNAEFKESPGNNP